MLGMIINALSGGLADKALSAYVARTTSTTEVDKAALAAAVEQAKVELERLRIEQGHWLTRSVRPAFAWVFLLYYMKLIVIDKMLGRILINYGVDPAWFTTDALSPELAAIGAAVVAFFFGGRTVEKVVDRVWRR